MLFIPEEKVKEITNRLLEEARERRRKQSLERRETYLKAKKEGRLDEYFENLNKDKIIS